MGQQCILEDWQARELLQHLYRQASSVRRLAEKLGASKSSVHRWLKGEQIPLLYRMKLCEMFPEEELLQVLKGPQLLRQYGLVDEEGRLNKPLALALLDAMMQDEAVKNEVLNYLLKYYKAELQERLGGTLPKIELHWDSGFERYLTEKKSKRITPRTLRDYKNIWDACLEGKALGWHLLKQLEGKKMMCRDGKQHSTGWARQVFRHYIRYLYIQGKLDWDTYTRLLLAIPGRQYKNKLDQKPITDEEILRTLKVLVEKRPDIHLVYLLMLYSGVRFEHILTVLKEWKPDELVYVQYIKSNIKRLTCFQQHCRYYLGMEGSVKPEAFMFFPRFLLEIIEEYRKRVPDRHRIYKVAVKKLGVLAPKYARIFGIRLMDAIMEDDVYKFILGKFSELTVTGGKYLWLLKKADEAYPQYIEYVNRKLNLNRSGQLKVEDAHTLTHKSEGGHP